MTRPSGTRTAAADRRRRVLKARLARESKTLAEIARRADFPTPNAIYNFLNGRSASLSVDTLEKLERVLPGITADMVDTFEPGSAATASHTTAGPSPEAQPYVAEITSLREGGRLYALLDAVENGQTVTLTRQRRPVARIVPEQPLVSSERRTAIAAIRELGRRNGRISADDILSARDDGRDEMPDA